MLFDRFLGEIVEIGKAWCQENQGFDRETWKVNQFYIAGILFLPIRVIGVVLSLSTYVL